MNGNGDQPRRLGFRFNSEISVGNIISAIVIVGGLIGIYTKTSGDIIGLDSRVGVLERAMIERRREEIEAVADVKKQLEDMLKVLYMMQGQQQAKQDKSGR
jgi:hypothetical protein